MHSPSPRNAYEVSRADAWPAVTAQHDAAPQTEEGMPQSSGTPHQPSVEDSNKYGRTIYSSRLAHYPVAEILVVGAIAITLFVFVSTVVNVLSPTE